MNKNAAIAVVIIVILILLGITLVKKDPPKPPVAPGPTTTTGAPVPAESSVLRFVDLKPMTIDRAYDQRRYVKLENTSDKAVAVWLECSQPDDLMVGFVGFEERAEGEGAVIIPAGETWTFPFVLHASDATKRQYEITLKASWKNSDGKWVNDLNRVVTVNVNAAELNVELSLKDAPSKADQARLIQILTITNLGENVPDLTVTFPEPLTNKVRSVPYLAKKELRKHGTIQLRIVPRLHANFTSLEGLISVNGHNQSKTIAYKVGVPEGKNVFVVMTRSTTVARNSGTHCTNRHSVDYPMPPPEGTQPREKLDVETDWGGSGLESGAGAAPDSDAQQDVVDGIGENARAAIADVDDLVPRWTWHDPEEFHGMSLPPRDTTLLQDLDRLDMLLGDMIADSEKEMAEKNRNRKRRKSSSLNYIPVFGPTKRLKASIPLIDLSQLASDPTLGKSHKGTTLAAFSLDHNDNSNTIRVRDVNSSAQWDLGKPGTDSRKPVVVKSPGKTDVLWMEDGKILKSELKPEGKSTPPTIVSDNADPDGTFRVRTDKKGEHHLLYKDKKGMVLQKGNNKRKLPAVAGDFVLDQNDKPQVVYKRRDGAVVHLPADGGTETVLTPESWKVGSPAFVKTKTGHRLFINRPLAGTPLSESGGMFTRDYSQDGKWSDLKQNIMLEEPIEEAVVMLNFKLPWSKASLRVMNTAFNVNGYTVGEIKQRVPNGRFAFRVPVNKLNLLSTGMATADYNKVNLKISGIGRGHFHITDLCEIYTKHAVIQDFVVAETREAAVEIASVSNHDIRHNEPDLALTANHWEPPQNARPGETLQAIIGLVNVGDVPVPAGTLVAKWEDTVIGRGAFDSVEPFAFGKTTIKVQIPFEWDVYKPLEFTVEANVKGDSQPSNNVVSFGIFRVPEEGLNNPNAADRVDPRLFKKAKDLTLPSDEPLPSTVNWFKVPIETNAKLQVELTEIPENIPVRLEMFNETGDRLVEFESDRRVDGTHFYLRLSVLHGYKIPQKSRLVIKWGEK